MFFSIIVNEIHIHNVLNKINVGKDFFILAQINNADVISVKKCNCHISTPNTRPGIIIAALVVQAQNSIIL